MLVLRSIQGRERLLSTLRAQSGLDGALLESLFALRDLSKGVGKRLGLVYRSSEASAWRHWPLGHDKGCRASLQVAAGFSTNYLKVGKRFPGEACHFWT